MHWLSHSAEQLIESCQGGPQAYTPDVLIVGSGYGGSVAALRFAQHGLDVAVLERGAEYRAGEFPNDLSQIGAFVRAEVSGKQGAAAVGYEDALFDFRVGTRANALVGNGLGGGSLINAAVALRPDARVFAQEAWPAPLRAQALDADFARAYDGLEIQSAQSQKSSPACVPQNTLKYQRMQDIGQAAQERFASARLTVTTEDVPLAIEFRNERPMDLGPRDACVGCGDCCSGCNHNAKLSLDKTYLPRARQAGAKMYTGVSVLYVQHLPDGQHPGRDWVVHCVRTTERGTWAQACEVKPTPLDAAYTFAVRAGRVVLSAGTFGSTEILLRSKAHGLLVADTWLGKGISANGDDLSAAYDLKKPANAVGEGSGPVQSRVVGPTISAVIRFHDHVDHRCSTITEDGGIPGMLAPAVKEILATLGILPQLVNFGLRAPRGQDPLVFQPQALDHSLALLGMGHDTSAGQAHLHASDARLSWAWDENATDPAPQLHRARAASVEDAGAEFLPNPASGVLPDRIASVLSGPKAPANWVTVHPLGGCRMGASPHTGVVNHGGQVFMPNGEVHTGLMVMDGSVIPTSLGVNPLLTITALAERACRLAVQALPAGTPQQLTLPVHPEIPPLLRAQPGAPRGATLSEVLRGRLLPRDTSQPLPTWLQSSAADGGSNAALFLEMDIPDWQQLWQDPSHTAQAQTSKAGSRSFTASRLVVDLSGRPSVELMVTGGRVQLFRTRPENILSRLSRLVRAGITYWITRWAPDSKRPDAKKSNWRVYWDGLKMLWHASAARIFDYQLTLSDGHQTYRLNGLKLIQPALTWSELAAWTVNQWRVGGWPAPQRRSVWDQLTQVDVQLFAGDDTKPLAAGRLIMDIPEMARRIVPQLKPGPDTVQALAAFASYPLMMARYLISSRLLDFRLPDYVPDLPAVDPATLPDDGQFELPHDKYPPIRLAGGEQVWPEAPVCLYVPLHTRSNSAPASDETIRIGLVHYAQPQVQTWVGNDGLRRFKSIVLLNGFAQNTLPFVAEELGTRSLAAMLYAQGWDVWLLEYRVSPFLRASAKLSSMDDIGACDIPAAVNHVLDHVQAQRQEPDLLPGQVFVLSHCVGSASMAMSLLGGHLMHPQGQPKVAGVLFSQFQPFVIGSVTAQMRLQVASLLVNAMGLEYVAFAAGTSQANGLHSLMDRFFASFDYDPQERCPGEHDLCIAHPDSTTCKRMSGFLSRLFRHDQLIESTPEHLGTHAKLDQYFGRTNLGVFLHGAKCVEYERVVNADGQNIYVTDENVRQFLTMPVMLLHGEDNVLFDKESLEETRRQFSRAFGAQRLATQHDQFLLAQGHAHFDCTIGKRAPEVIFSPVVSFFDKAFQAEMPVQHGHNRLRARLPRTGPLVGWTRRVADKLVLRIWMEVDNTQADAARAAMTLVSAGRYRRVQAWKLQNKPLDGVVGVSPAATPDMGVTYAVADVEVPASWTGRITVAMVSLHSFTADARVDTESEAQTEHHWPQDWGQPMTLHEACHSEGRSPEVTASSVQVAVGGGDDSDCVFHAAGPTEIPVQALAEDTAQIPPLDLPLTLQDAHAMLAPLTHLVHDQRALARQAQPGTLSRQRRTIRWMDDCVVRLRGDQFAHLAPIPPVAGTVLRFFASTCRHPGITEMEAQRSDDTLGHLAQRQRQQPASFMWMLGDQIYADARAGLADSASIIERLLPRYREAFGSKGFKDVARSLPLYMVMDDHEIGDNWSSDELQLGARQRLLAQNARSAYDAFQRAHGPAPAGPQGMDAVLDAGAAAFISLNTRIHRTRALQGGRRILLDAQWTLLENWLCAEQRRGKHPKFIVTGSVFAPGLVQAAGSPSPRDTDSWQLVEAERKRLLSFIATQHIDNVVFLSGDYHCSASATIRFSHSAVQAYALVTPPLHAPLRFANVAADRVLVQEQLVVEGGNATIHAKAWNGDGWLECEVRTNGAGVQTLHAHFRTQRMDAPAADEFSEVWVLRT